MKPALQFVTALFTALTITAAARPQSLYRLTELGTGHYGFGSPGDVNNNGDVVGYIIERFDDTHAFLWTDAGGLQLLGELPNTNKTSAQGINDAGQVVGEIWFAVAYGLRAFSWTSEAGMHELALLPNRIASSAFGINKVGQIAGYSQLDTGHNRPVLWTSAGEMQDLSLLPDRLGGMAFGINDAGEVVGSNYDSHGYDRAVLWTVDGVVHDLGMLPGTNRSAARDVNSAGQVVGYSTDEYFPRAFFWTSAGGMQDLGVLPEGTQSFATAINDAGQVVGFGNLGVMGSRAFVWTSEHGMRELTSLLDESGTGWTLGAAGGINDRGEIVASGWNAAGESHLFLLTPIPEPTTVFLAISAVLFFCVGQRDAWFCKPLAIGSRPLFLMTLPRRATKASMPPNPRQPSGE